MLIFRQTDFFSPCADSPGDTRQIVVCAGLCVASSLAPWTGLRIPMLLQFLHVNWQLSAHDQFIEVFLARVPRPTQDDLFDKPEQAAAWPMHSLHLFSKPYLEEQQLLDLGIPPRWLSFRL